MLNVGTYSLSHLYSLFSFPVKCGVFDLEDNEPLYQFCTHNALCLFLSFSVRSVCAGSIVCVWDCLRTVYLTSISAMSVEIHEVNTAPSHN